MESIDQEIANNKQMAKEYYRIANIFTILCCFTGIIFLLIGTSEYNSKAKRCWRRIRELEGQKQQLQVTTIIHCQSCGHTIKEIITFCPLCGEKIDPLYAEEQKQKNMSEVFDKDIDPLHQADLERIAKQKRINRGVGSLLIAILVLAFPSWLTMKIGAFPVFSCFFCILGIIISISIIKQERKLGIAGIVLNAFSILVVVVMIIITYTVLGGPVGLFNSL